MAKIILSSDVENLGFKGDVVTVADGYARNYLVPKGLAIHASKGALKQAELMQKARAEKEARAAANRTAFGRSKAERALSEARKDIAERRLDGHKRDEE